MTVGRSMSLKDFRKYLSKLKVQLAGAEGAIVRGIHSGLLRSVGTVQQSVDHAMPASPRGAIGAVNTGDYKRRWRVQLTATGGRLFNDHPAADVIERGRRPGRKGPPPSEMKIWAMRRLGLSDAEAEKAKWPLSKAIGKRGLTGRRVLTNPATTDRITRNVMDEVKAEVRAALRRAKGP